MTDGAILTVRGFSFWYGAKQALHEIDLDIAAGEVIAFMGPSGCGKTTLLKSLNRMQDDVPGARRQGTIHFRGTEIHAPHVEPEQLRRHFGWVAQKPDPFPDSIYENVAYGPLLHGLADRGPDTDALVERALRRAGLWDEVADRLELPGTDLSGGQQQRLCIARALAAGPEVLLMDEPCSAIDPFAAAHVEELIRDLRRDHAVVLITHNLAQARRLADRAAFFHLGRVVETGPATAVFSQPAAPETRAYLAGASG